MKDGSLENRSKRMVSLPANPIPYWTPLIRPYTDGSYIADRPTIRKDENMAIKSGSIASMMVFSDASP